MPVVTFGWRSPSLGLLAREATVCIGDNQPYRMDETYCTILRHAIGNRLPYLELEIRQDAISGDEGQRSWCERLATVPAATLREPGLEPLAGLVR